MASRREKSREAEDLGSDVTSCLRIGDDPSLRRSDQGYKVGSLFGEGGYPPSTPTLTKDLIRHFFIDEENGKERKVFFVRL